MALSLSCTPVVITRWSNQGCQTAIYSESCRHRNFLKTTVILVLWHDTYMLPCIRSSSSHGLDPGGQFLVKAFHIDFCVESATCVKMNRDMTTALLVITLKTMKWTAFLVFSSISSSFNERADQRLFYVFNIWSWQEFSHLRKNKACSVWEEQFVCTLHLVITTGVQLSERAIKLHATPRMNWWQL